jgi:hypothetical protein
MPDLPTPRCATCMTVLSPQWRVCHVCKTPVSSVPLTQAPASESLFKPGDRIAYRDADTRQLQVGRVARVIVEGQDISLALDSGITVQGRHVRALARTNAHGETILAMTVREEDLLVIPTTAPAPDHTPAAPAPRSSWYQHWKDIATMTAGILPHEPRLTTILGLIDRCTVAFEKHDEPAFLRAKLQLANFIKASTPRPKPSPAAASPPAAQSA